MVGPAEAHREKLRRLAKLGVTQFNVYLMCGEEEQTLEDYKKEILPALKSVAALDPSTVSHRGNGDFRGQYVLTMFTPI